LKDKKDKITIGLFVDAFFPMIDGVIMVVDNYAKRLVKKENVVVFAPKYDMGYDDEKLPYKVVRCKSIKLHIIDYSLPTPSFDKKFLKELELYKLDIVHIHSPFTIGKLGVKYAKEHNIPLIGSMHSQIKQDFKRAVKLECFANILTHQMVKVYNNCDECWATNEEVARVYFEDYGYKCMPGVMRNATEMIPLRSAGDDLKRIDEKYDIQSDEKVFLFVGRINALKNVYFIVNSLRKLKTIAPDLHFKMLFVGSGQDTEKLKALIVKCGMSRQIILCGRISDRKELQAYYKRADLFLFPSMYDTNALVQIEAACEHTPTLFLQGAITAYSVTDGVNGFISSNDEKSYAEYILRIIEDKKLYEKVSQNCYRDLYKNWDDVVKEVLDRYNYLIEFKEELEW